MVKLFVPLKIFSFNPHISLSNRRLQDVVDRIHASGLTFPDMQRTTAAPHPNGTCPSASNAAAIGTAAGSSEAGAAANGTCVVDPAAAVEPSAPAGSAGSAAAAPAPAPAPALAAAAAAPPGWASAPSPAPGLANHVLFNRYLPGEGIMPHTDGPSYAPQAAILSLGAPILLCFWRSLADSKRGAGAAVASLWLEPRSVCVFSEGLYWECLHGIEEVKEDAIYAHCANAAVAGVTVGESIPRVKPRMSLTVRRITPVFAKASNNVKEKQLTTEVS